MVASSSRNSNLLKWLSRSTWVIMSMLTVSPYRFLAAQTVSDSHSDLPSPTASASAVGLPDYIVGPDDLLAIQVYDAPDITGEYRVSPTGQIELPLLPQMIMAAGLTPTQLSERIREIYRSAEIITHPRVTVVVKEPRVHSITIAGAVKRPQIYPSSVTVTLTDLLSQAEGLEDDASTTATVTRGEIARRALQQSGACDSAVAKSGCTPIISVDLKQLLEVGDPTSNVQVYPGDIVNVQHAGIVYVVGAVNRPGGYPLKTGQEDMTVLWALALAQDFTPTASKTRATIIRKNPAEKSGRKEIPVNIKRVLAGKSDDIRMQANDILYIVDSTRKRALHHGADAAVQAATFGLIYHY